MKKDSELRWGLVPVNISKQQAEGTGMAMTLICLLLGYYGKQEVFYKLAIILIVINMTIPMLYYPLAIVWFSLSNLLSKIAPKIILTIVYLTVLLPVAIVRRLRGYDPLLLNAWKKSSTSVMNKRDHVYVSADIDKPY